LETCDDCGQEYPSPPYYTFPAEACHWTEDGVEIDHACTENICPNCAGPYMGPDDPEDKRGPMMPIDEILKMLEVPS
jgi:hypothetical protein